MRKIAVLLVGLLVAATAQASLFTDVPKTHWAYDAIAEAVEAGILQGYDGKFAGNRQLNRYQMAVITAKMLDRFDKSGKNKDAFKGFDFEQLEALTLEFSDEISSLSSRVNAIEDILENLGTKTEAKPAAAVDHGFTAYAAFALVMNQDDAGGNRYSSRNLGLDSNFFDMQQVSLGVDKQVNEGLHFHAQFDFTSEIQLNTNNVGVNEAYFFVDELASCVGGKVGAFASPFSMEHNGPFRTLNMTITPSIVNTYHEGFRFHGLEMQCNKRKALGDIQWKFGIVSGSDNVGAIGVAGDTNNNNVLDGLESWAPLMHDLPANVNSGENDDGIGYYLWLGKSPVGENTWGWNFAYFDNGGDTGATAPKTASSETYFYQLGLEWMKEDFVVMLQYLTGKEDNGAFDIDFDTFYLLFNYKVTDKSSVTLRYDHVQWDTFNDVTAKGITFAFNRQITENSMLQFEYLTPDSDEIAANEPDDDLIQLRYRVHF